MKKIFVFPMLLATGVASASTTFYYDAGYDGTNGCPGWFLSPNATSCGDAVTKITTPTVSGRAFSGYYINGTQIVDSRGNFVLDGATATNLVNSSDPGARNPRHAEAGYTSQSTITVATRQNWDGLQNGWYSCSVYGFHMCQMGGTYYTPPAGNCWSFGTWPCDSNGQNCKYDYVFNSYRMADGKKFLKASCYGGSGCWNNPYPNGLATGNQLEPNACTTNYLGPLINDPENNLFNLSEWNIYPFACKRIKDGSDWVDEYVIPNGHGRIKLELGNPESCKYELVCDNGYEPATSTTKQNYVECTRDGCRGWFDGFVWTLSDFKNLNTSCVPTVITTN